MSKKIDDRRVLEEVWTVHCVELATVSLQLTEVWNTLREFTEDDSRMLGRREIVHLKAALEMNKDIHAEIVYLANLYNKDLKKLNSKVLPFQVGKIDQKGGEERVDV